MVLQMQDHFCKLEMMIWVFQPLMNTHDIDEKSRHKDLTNILQLSVFLKSQPIFPESGKRPRNGPEIMRLKIIIKRNPQCRDVKSDHFQDVFSTLLENWLGFLEN
uniref:Uncharacterized protein n=1 Tax=Cacopsylla melanoneura TaxID=428564 RepID=A0A8D9B8A4_9HEMI